MINYLVENPKVWNRVQRGFNIFGATGLAVGLLCMIWGAVLTIEAGLVVGAVACIVGFIALSVILAMFLDLPSPPKH